MIPNEPSVRTLLTMILTLICVFGSLMETMFWQTLRRRVHSWLHAKCSRDMSRIVFQRRVSPSLLNVAGKEGYRIIQRPSAKIFSDSKVARLLPRGRVMICDSTIVLCSNNEEHIILITVCSLLFLVDSLRRVFGRKRPAAMSAHIVRYNVFVLHKTRIAPSFPLTFADRFSHSSINLNKAFFNLLSLPTR